MVVQHDFVILIFLLAETLRKVFSTSIRTVPYLTHAFVLSYECVFYGTYRENSNLVNPFPAGPTKRHLTATNDEIDNLSLPKRFINFLFPQNRHHLKFFLPAFWITILDIFIQPKKAE